MTRVHPFFTGADPLRSRPSQHEGREGEREGGREGRRERGREGGREWPGMVYIIITNQRKGLNRYNNDTCTLTLYNCCTNPRWIELTSNFQN